MRIKSDTWKLRASFLVGGMVLNHIISAIDALYLLRLKNITFLPKNNNGVNEISLQIRF